MSPPVTPVAPTLTRAEIRLHFPHRDDAIRFARLMAEFVEQTEPAQLDSGVLGDKVLERERRAA